MDTRDDTTLALRLRLARQVCGLTRLQLAVRAGVTPSTVQRLEGGATRRPQPETLATLARALNVAPEWLLSDDPNSPGGP